MLSPVRRGCHKCNLLLLTARYEFFILNEMPTVTFAQDNSLSAYYILSIGITAIVVAHVQI